MAGAEILIVEDEVVVGMELQAKLTSLGYAVAAVTDSGEDAIAKAGMLRPDLVLMDIQLAGDLDGIEAAKRIRDLYDIPVVFLTAHADEKTLQRAKLSEPFGYLVKPFSAAELHSTIEVSLHKHARDAEEKTTSQWFATTLDALGGAVIVADGQSLVRHMNALAETLTGWKREDAVDRPLTEVFVLKDRLSGATVADPLATCQTEEGKCTAIHYVLVSKDQTAIDVENSALAMNDAEGNINVAIFSFRETAQRVYRNQDWFSHATNLSVAAALCYQDEQYREAESFYKRSLAILEENVGSDHPKVAKLLEDLANVCIKLGDANQASLLRTRATRILCARQTGTQNRQNGDRRPLT